MRAKGADTQRERERERERGREKHRHFGWVSVYVSLFAFFFVFGAFCCGVAVATPPGHYDFSVFDFRFFGGYDEREREMTKLWHCKETMFTQRSRMDGWMDGRMDGWTDGWVGCVGGWTVKNKRYCGQRGAETGAGFFSDRCTVFGFTVQTLMLFVCI